MTSAASFKGGRVTDPEMVRMRKGSLEDERTSDFVFYSILVDVCAMDLGFQLVTVPIILNILKSPSSNINLKNLEAGTWSTSRVFHKPKPFQPTAAAQQKPLNIKIAARAKRNHFSETQAFLATQWKQQRLLDQQRSKTRWWFRMFFIFTPKPWGR